MLRKGAVKIVLFIALAILLSWGYLKMPAAFFSIDSRLRDFMFLARGELPKSDRVVIVDIDEKALKTYGQWPWPRDLFAQLLYALRDAGAGIVGLDIVFAEADRTSPARLLRRYECKGSLEDNDAILAEAFANTPTIGGYIFTFEKTKHYQDPPNIPAIFIQKGLTRQTPILRPLGVVKNIEILQEALYSSGFFNNTPDDGGMIRSVPLVMDYDGMIYPSLALEMIRIYIQAQKVSVYGSEVGVEKIVMGDLEIPTDPFGRLVVNFRGGSKHFRYISAADILSGSFDPKEIEGKFILIGTSAVGLYDLRSIPFANAIAGVEVHANAIDNILSGDFLYKPSDALFYDLLAIWGIVAVLALLLSFVGSKWVLPVSVALFFALYEAFFFLLFDRGIVLNLFFPIVAFIATFIVSVGYDYIVASRQKEQIKRLFGKKVSPGVMEYLLEHSQEALVESKEVEATVFFSDIRSFTTISEKLNSPKRLIALLNEYMTPMVESIVAHKGTIDKFIGDAIMAYWNAPVPVKNHADEAVSSAIEQLERLHLINDRIEATYGLRLAIGMGIHTGIVTAGDMGSEGRSDYTVIGDSVNLASRLEGLTKQYGAQIVISKDTKERLTREYTIIPLDLVEVKGKTQAVEIFEVIHPHKNITPKQLQKYTQAVELFREGSLREAFEIFSALGKENPQTLFSFYIRRCETFLNDPSKEFTPILKMYTK